MQKTNRNADVSKEIKEKDCSCKFTNECIFKKFNIAPWVETVVDSHCCVGIRDQGYYLGMRPGTRVTLRINKNKLQVRYGYKPIKILSEGVPYSPEGYPVFLYSEDEQRKPPKGTIFKQPFEDIKEKQKLKGAREIP